jgi:hypothetical protein
VEVEAADVEAVVAVRSEKVRSENLREIPFLVMNTLHFVLPNFALYSCMLVCDHARV